MLRVGFVVFVLLFSLFIYLLRTLPYWAIAAIIAGILLFFKLFAGRMLRSLFLAPFKAKGKVLRGASVVVHAVTAASKPPNAGADDRRYDFDDESENESDDDSDGATGRRESAAVEVLDRENDPRNYYHIDATIAPAAQTGQFTHWEPGELRLIRPSTKVDPWAGENDESCVVLQTEIFEEGRFKADEGYKVGGPHRLRLHVGVQPGTQQLKFQYYFESFGEVRLPEQTGTDGSA